MSNLDIQPPFDLFLELRRIECEMSMFFPYLNYKQRRELNKAIKSIKTIQTDLKNEEF